MNQLFKITIIAKDTMPEKAPLNTELIAQRFSAIEAPMLLEIQTVNAVALNVNFQGQNINTPAMAATKINELCGRLMACLLHERDSQKIAELARSIEDVAQYL